MLTCHVSHHILCDKETFWKIFFSLDYMDKMFKQGLGFPYFEQFELVTKDDGAIHRKIRVEPKLYMPTIVRKVVGDAVQYVETGDFDPVREQWKWWITPSRLADRVDISGNFWCEPRPDGTIDRKMDCTIKVRIFGVGGVIAKFIKDAVEDNYVKAADFTNDYVKTL